MTIRRRDSNHSRIRRRTRVLVEPISSSRHYSHATRCHPHPAMPRDVTHATQFAHSLRMPAFERVFNACSCAAAGHRSRLRFPTPGVWRRELNVHSRSVVRAAPSTFPIAKVTHCRSTPPSPEVALLATELIYAVQCQRLCNDVSHVVLGDSLMQKAILQALLRP